MARVLLILVIAAAIVLAGTVGCFAAKQQCAPGSFLKNDVSSVDGLVKQLSANRAVAARYARHYGMSTDSFIKYVKTNVKVITITKPMTTTTYYVAKRGGRVLWKQRRFPAGTKMFATREGKPLIEVRCGNPISKRLPAPPKVTAAPPPAPEVKVEAQPPIFLPPATEAVPTVPVVPVVPTVETVPAAAAAPPVAVPPVARLVIPALVGVAVTRSSPPPIPEPGTMLAACGILAPVVFVFRRRRLR